MKKRISNRIATSASRVTKWRREERHPETGYFVTIAQGERPTYELRWPIHEYEIVEDPPPGLAVVAKYYGQDWPQGGAFVPRGHLEGSERVPPPSREYDPVPVTDDILTDVSRLDLERSERLLAFVNHRGCLGVGIPIPPSVRSEGWTGGRDRYIRSFDGVQVTRKWLAWIQKRLVALADLQEGRRRDWDEFAFDLSSVLGNIRPATRPMANGLVPCYSVPRLLDALFLGMWQRATGGARMRRCPECGALFMPDRRDQMYCKTDGQQKCARRASVKRFRARPPRSPARPRDSRVTPRAAASRKNGRD